MNATQDLRPQKHYDIAKAKLKKSFKNSINILDHQLIEAQKIPSLSWYIFEVNETAAFHFFRNLEHINYIDDIHSVANSWIEDTNLILKEPCRNPMSHGIPFHISHFFYDVLIAIIRNGRIGAYNRIKYHRQYIAFYEKTIEPCFKLQERITRQMNAGREESTDISSDIRNLCILFHFSHTNNLFLEGDEASHKRQYKKSLRIVKNAERLERGKLFFKKIFGKI